MRWVRSSRSASACSFSTLRLNLVLAHGIPLDFRGGVHFVYTAIRHWVSPEFIGSRSCVPMAFTAESPPARAKSSQGSSGNGCRLCRFHHGPIFVRLSFSTPIIVIEWACPILKVSEPVLRCSIQKISAIGTQLRDLINSGLARWRLTVYIEKMTPSPKAAEIPRVSATFSLSVENEWADAGRDGRTCLARPNSQARTGTFFFFTVQLTTRRIGNNNRLVDTLLKVLIIQCAQMENKCGAVRPIVMGTQKSVRAQKFPSFRTI